MIDEIIALLLQWKQPYLVDAAVCNLDCANFSCFEIQAVAGVLDFKLTLAPGNPIVTMFFIQIFVAALKKLYFGLRGVSNFDVPLAQSSRFALLSM